MSSERGRLFVITGIQGAGKTTIGTALARTLNRSVFIDGDLVGSVVVSGREPMSEPASQEAIEQLLFRYVGALVLADTYRTAGFDAVIADNIFGDYLEDFLELAAPETVHLVMLHPSQDTVRLRDMERGGDAYRDGFTIQGLWESVESGTRRAGLWLDTSHMTVAETVLEILKRQPEAEVAPVSPA
ncbi:hypothetical protein PZ938_01015 [Luteipulveratus sp. YIM 133132]|uniref:Phosphotransferase n=1 Tax=Luteipulveratus flavus TaxID=3031728 RepID=A0ABT6C894_9MICO|nr:MULTISPECIES: hypothetical protein [unclassified Luteipulveratus]MDE9364175.1 hypothetical protein [Luteipulveratus sp. YIM 133132]MDF8264936.1 hypothetical protein [Luteipulveratus sp. YIM 133296]